jgi:hypothetical protein
MNVKINKITMFAFSLLLLVGCAYDNYEEPQSYLTGRIVYQGEPIGVEFRQVEFELYEPGWELSNRLVVPVSQEGEFSALLFNAQYKLIIPSHQGPFMSIENASTSSDTILVDINGNTEMDIEVMPFYMFNSANLTVSGSSVSANVSLNKVVTGVDERNIERVVLYLNKSQFISGNVNVSSAEIGGGDIANIGNITLSTGIPDMTPSQSYVYARVGVKIGGVEDMLFSPVQKLEF